MRLYLLSVEELKDGSDGDRLRAHARSRLDVCRLEKVQRLRPGKEADLALGAGLLLQLAAQSMDQHRAQSMEQRTTQSMEQSSEIMQVQPELLTVSGVLAKLGDTVQIAYRQGNRGKPDFAAGPWHFNLSHSEQYVCCALAREEIGVDIQRMRQLNEMQLAERFFSQAERLSLLECSLGEKRTDRFYRLWVKKEAYAKLTGEGIAATVGKDTEELSEIVEWQEYREPEGYRMALCRYKSCYKKI